MAKRNLIVINDFNLFLEFVKTLNKIVESAKFILTQNGVEVYGARGRIARCELVSNAICLSSDDTIEFSISNVSMLVKILQTVKDIHEDDYSDLKFSVDLPFLRLESKKFKTKISACDESIIAEWVSKKVQTQLVPEVEFTTTSDLIKRFNSHTFIFSDASSLRVYLEAKKDMEKNAIFATLGNKETNLNNEVTLKFGLMNSGELPENRSLIIDVERLNLFNSIQSNNIKITLAKNVNVLISKTQLTGKNNTYFNFSIYNTLLRQ